MLVLPQTESLRCLFTSELSWTPTPTQESLVNSSGGFATAADAVTYNLIQLLH